MSGNLRRTRMGHINPSFFSVGSSACQIGIGRDPQSRKLLAKYLEIKHSENTPSEVLVVVCL